MIHTLKDILTNAIKTECALCFNFKNNDTQNLFLKFQEKEIFDAHSYLLDGQGKLIRPLLLLLTAGCIGGERAISTALSSAIAVEFVHSYSLIHDDLPCMDNDTLRRGQPTTHVIFGEAKALLVGDGLLTAAFEILSREKNYFDAKIPKFHSLIVKLTQTLTQAAGSQGMIWGQWLDITQSQLNASQTETSDWEVFQTMHINKTGKLFGACFAMGLLCGIWSVDHSYEEQDIQNMHQKFLQIGYDIGLSFQIIDDILDKTQNSEQLGKTAGKDAEQNKLTAIKILGLENAQQMAQKYLNEAIKNLNTCFSEKFKTQDKNILNYRDNLLKLVTHLSQRTA